MKKISSALYYPEVCNNPEYAVVLLHGYGASNQDMHGVSRRLSHKLGGENIIFAAPNAPLAMNDYAGRCVGYKWFEFRELTLDLVLAGIREAEFAIESFVDELSKSFSIDRDRIILGGFSQGGMMSLHSAMRSSNKPYLAAISFSGALMVPELLAHEKKNPTQNICLIHGSDDEVVLPGELDSAVRSFKQQGINPSARMIRGMGHFIDSEALTFAADFVSQCLSRNKVAK